MRAYRKLCIILCFLIIHMSVTVVFTQEQTEVAQCTLDVLGREVTDPAQAIPLLNEQRSAGMERAAEADLLYCLGLVQLSQGEFPTNQQPFNEALITFQRALTAYREVQDSAGAARSQHQWGMAYFAIGDLANAEPQLNGALNTALTTMDYSIQGDINYDLAVFHRTRGGNGDLEQALAYLNSAYNNFFTSGETRKQATILLLRGRTRFNLFDIDGAIQDYTDAADLFVSLNEPAHQAEAIYGIGQVYQHIGDLRSAETYYGQALDIFKQVGDVRYEGRTTAALGNIYFNYDYNTAEEVLNQALELNQKASDNLGRSMTLSYLGEVQLAAGNTSDALASYNNALSIARESNDTQSQAMAHLGRGRVRGAIAAATQNPLRESLNDFGEATRLYRDELNDRYSLQRVYLSEARALYDWNATLVSEYETLLFEALNIAVSIGDFRGQVTANRALAEIYLERNLPEDARNYFAEALPLALQLGDDVLYGDLNYELGRLALRDVDLNTSREFFETARSSYIASNATLEEALVSSDLGYLLFRTGASLAALDTYSDSQTFLEGYNDPVRETPLVGYTIALNELRIGQLYLHHDLYDLAEEHLTRAESLFTSIQDESGLAMVTVEIGRLKFEQLDYGGALTSYRQAQRLAEQSENIRAAGLAEVGVGAAQQAGGTGTELEIQRNIETGWDRLRDFGDPDGVRMALMLIGEAALIADDYAGAITYFSDARNIADFNNDPQSVARAMGMLAKTYAEDPSDVTGAIAAQSYTEALAFYVEIGDFNAQGTALLNLGSIALRRSQYGVAIEHFTDMRTAYRNAENKIGESLALINLGQAYQSQRRYSLSLNSYNEALAILETELDNSDPLIDMRMAAIAEGAGYRSLGDLQRILSLPGPSEENLQIALSILNDPSLLASDELSQVYVALGNLYLSRREYVEARESFLTARDIANRASDRFTVGLALDGLGRVYTLDGNSDNLAEAERSFEQALSVFRDEVPNPPVAREIVEHIADYYYIQGRYSDAEDWYGLAWNIAREVNDPVGQGYALLQLGSMRADRFRFDEATVNYDEAIRQFDLADDYIGLGEAYLQAAGIATIEVDYGAALTHYQDALFVYEEADDKLRQARVYTLIGETYQHQNQLANALNQHFRALDFLDEFKLEGGPNAEAVATATEARIYRNIGIVRLDSGQEDAARDAFRTAQNLALESGNSFEIGATQVLFGQTYYNDGFFLRAIEAYDRAVACFTDSGNIQQRGELHVSIGNALYQQAIAVRTGTTFNVLAPSTNPPTPTVPPQSAEQQADDDSDILGLPDSESFFGGTVGDGTEAEAAPPVAAPGLDTVPGLQPLRSEGLCIDAPSTIAPPTTYIELLSEARIRFQRGLEVARMLGDPILEARAQQGLGKVFNLQNDSQSRRRLIAALDRTENLEVPSLRSGIYTTLGLLAEEDDDISTAISYYEQAIELVENIYLDIRLEPGQVAFASENIQPYHRMISLNITLNPELAFEYAERSRSRTLLYQLGSEKIDFGAGLSADSLQSWQDQRAVVVNLRQQVADKLESRQSEPNQATQQQLEEEILALRRRILEVEDGLDAIREEVETQNAVLAQVTKIEPLSLDQIQSALGRSNTTIISYYIVPDSSAGSGAVYAFIIDENSFEREILDITEEQLRSEIRRVRSNSDYEVLLELHNAIIDPVLPHIKNQKVVIIPHGVMNNLPFGALTSDGEAFFMEDYTVTYASSATFYALLQENRESKMGSIQASALVYGNPATPEIFREHGENRAALGSLPGAATEANNIASILDVEAQIGPQATETLLWTEARNVNVIHIAAHGVFDPTNPLASFMALADDADRDGALEVREIYSLSLADNQPLVVLSACDTAVGGRSESDDVQSLSRAFLISGARSVVASLWKVDDEATQVLMTRFYENIINENMDPADALSDAQMYVRSFEQWESPVYWAAFVLIGLPE